MKLNLFTYWNKTLKCSSQIQFDDHEPLIAKTQVLRACAQMEFEKLKAARQHTQLVWLGLYDDETMKFEEKNEPEILIDFDDVLDERRLFEDAVKAAKEEGE